MTFSFDNTGKVASEVLIPAEVLIMLRAIAERVRVRYSSVEEA